MRAAGAGVLLLDSASGQRVRKQAVDPSQISIQVDYQPNLDRDEIYAFMESSSGTSPWVEPRLSRSGYKEADEKKRKSLGSLPQPVTVFWAVRRHYAVMSKSKYPGMGGSQIVGSFDVDVVREQKVNIAIASTLLIKDTTPDDVRAKIQALFDKYDPLKDRDAVTYAIEQIKNDSTISVDSFLVENTFSIQKNGPVIPHNEQEQAILAFYKGRGEIWGGDWTRNRPERDPSYFDRTETRPVLMRTELIGRVPTTPDAPEDSLHEIVVRPGDTSKTTETRVREVGDEEARLSECTLPPSQITRKEWPLITLSDWPEFKVVWRDTAYQVRCVRVVLRLPVLQSRRCKLELWVYTRFPSNFDVVAGEKIVQCASSSALSPAVVGVAVTNIKAGLVAFTALFASCLFGALLRYIPCMIPGLTLIKTIQPPDWKDV